MGANAREIHVGIVVDNVDPEKRGRVMVECATLAAEGTTLPDWVEPVFPYLAAADGETSSNGGWCFVPDIGIAVELEITNTSPRDESPGAISLDAPDIRWRACLFALGADELGSEFSGDHYPHRRGIQTRSGHALVFDDFPGAEEVKLQRRVGDAYTFLDFDSTGSAILSTSGGHLFYLNNDEGISLIDGVNQNLLSMGSDGWYLASAASDLVKAGGGEVSILTGNLLINASGVTAKVGGFAVSQLGLETAVLVDGLLGLQSMLAASLTELAAAVAILPGAPTPNTGTLIAALNAGAFSATLLSSE